MKLNLEERFVLAVAASKALSRRRKMRRMMSQRFNQGIVTMGLFPPPNARLLAQLPR